MSHFNKERFSYLLTKAKGERSLNQFGLNSGVDAGYISRYINLKRNNPPSPEVLKKIADAAYNDVTYAELLESAGYIQYDITEKIFDEHEFREVEGEYKATFDYLDEFVEEMKKRGYDYSDKSRKELAEMFVKLLKAADIIKDTNK